MRRKLRGAFALQMAPLKRALIAAGGTADPRCDCGQEVPAKQWNLHVANCPYARGEKGKEQEPTGS